MTNKYISDFCSVIDYLDQTNNLPINSDMRLVISFRPNIDFTSLVVWNRDYNARHQELMIERKEKQKRITQIRKQENKIPGRLTGKKITLGRSYVLQCENAYELLSHLEDKCLKFNEETDSKLNVPRCVKKVLSIQDHKKVEDLDLNWILHEHKMAMKRESSMLASIQQSQLEVQELNESLRKYGVNDAMKSLTISGSLMNGGVHHIDKFEASSQTDQEHMSISPVLSCLLDQQIYFEKIRQTDKNDLLLSLAVKFNRSLSKHIDRITKTSAISSDECSVVSECGILGHIMPTIPEGERIKIDGIIKSLIIKSNKATQNLLNLSREYSGLIKTGLNATMMKILNLD